MHRENKKLVFDQFHDGNDKNKRRDKSQKEYLKTRRKEKNKRRDNF